MKTFESYQGLVGVFSLLIGKLPSVVIGEALILVCCGKGPG